MADYVRKPQLMLKRGMNVTMPGDRLSPEYFQYVRNVRSYKLGEWRQRPGMTLLYPALGEQINYLNRVDNNVTTTFRRMVGTTAGKIYFDDATHTLLTSSDTGYSATGFTSVTSRPDRSPLPYVFVGNSSRQSKFSPTGTRTEWGLASPKTAPDPFLSTSNFNEIDNGNSLTGAVAVNGVLALVTRLNTTIQYAIPDTSFPCRGSIVPVTMSENIGPGTLVIMFDGFVNTELLVDDVFQPIEDTSIAGIIYDSGTTGPCTIQLATATTGLRKDCVVRINSSENVRVVSVTDGLDGLPSFRCSTTVNHVIGEGIQGLRSFRAYIGPTPSPGFIISCSAIQLTANGSGITSVTKTFAFPLNMTSSGGRPIQPEDYLHIGLRVSDFSQVSEIQVQFDCDSTTNDFTHNYFYKSLRPPDFQTVISQSQTAIQAQQTGIQRTQIDDFVRQQIDEEGNQFFGLPTVRQPDDINRALGSGFDVSANLGPISDQATSGVNQWTEFFIPISEFQRVGSDNSRGWGDVLAFRITATVSGTPVIQMDDIWLGKTYGPNTHDLQGYNYVYRMRNSSTGSRSNPSPPTRSPIDPLREQVFINAPSYPDTQADFIDYYRIGGTLTNYYYVGSALIGAQFIDTLADDMARRNPILEVDRFKPWPRADLPKSGTCNVVGTTVTWASGDTFNTSWLRGTSIIINNLTYSLYTNPASTTFLELNESGGAQTGVPFQIPEPLLGDQPLPVVFGPFSGASGEFLFGCGDTTNPGYLYWTNGNDPESSSPSNSIELCGPSEKVVSGVVLDGIPYCFSDKRSWRILPSFTGGQTGAGSDFYPQETSMGKGLVGKYAICVGDAMYYVSFDGVYRTRGDALESLTDDSLAPLFDRDGTFVTDFVVPVSPINMSSPDDISLEYCFDGLYLTYKGRDSNYYTFYMSFLSRGWALDSIATGSITQSSREIRTVDADNVVVGTTGGKVMIRSNAAFRDDADPISCEVWDREEIWDDVRLTIQVGDVIVDTDPANATMTPTLRYDSNTSNDVLATITGNGRDQFTRDVNSGSGRIVRGAALDLTWSNGTSGSPKLYAWEPSGLIKPEEIVNRASDWDNAGYPGTKWLQGFRLKGDTFGLTKDFQVESDGGTFVQSFTFTANGEQVITYSLTNPVVGHEFRIRGMDSDLWRNMGVEWIFEPEPEQATTWETQVTSFDLPFFSHMREVMIAHRSTADITMTVITDSASDPYPITHGGGARVRTYLPVKSVKSKYHKFRFTSSSPFGLWIQDIECRVGPWGRTEAYATKRPFGDLSRTNGGARI